MTIAFYCFAEAAMTKLSIVLGTYNESENISKFIPVIESILSNERIDGEIVVVDDSSPDGTATVVQKLELEYGNIRLFSRPEKLGPGSAHADGYKHALGEIIIGMDTDFSHDPADIPRFIAKINEGFDVVQASRYIPGGAYEAKSFQTFKKKLASRVGNILVRILLGVPIHDFTTSYRAVRREVAQSVKTESAGNSFFMEFIFKAYRSGFKITEIPIVFKDRVSGKSKLKLGKQSFIALMDLLKLSLS